MSAVVARVLVVAPLRRSRAHRVGIELIVFAFFGTRGIALCHLCGGEFVDYTVGNTVLGVEITDVGCVRQAHIFYAGRDTHIQERIAGGGAIIV